MVCVKNDDCQGMLKPETRNASLAKGHRPLWCQTPVKSATDGYFLQAFVAVSYIMMQKHHSKNISHGKKNVKNQISSLKSYIFWDLKMEISNQESMSVLKNDSLCANLISLFHILFHDSDQHDYLIRSLETHWPHGSLSGQSFLMFLWGRGNFPNRWSTSPNAIMLPSVHDGCAFVWARCARN